MALAYITSQTIYVFLGLIIHGVIYGVNSLRKKFFELRRNPHEGRSIKRTPVLPADAADGESSLASMIGGDDRDEENPPGTIRRALLKQDSLNRVYCK